MCTGRLWSDTETRGNVEAGVAHADSQGAVGVTICDKPSPLDFDHEVEEAGGDLIGYGSSNRVGRAERFAIVYSALSISLSMSVCAD
jgi:hypothetical protein